MLEPCLLQPCVHVAGPWGWASENMSPRARYLQYTCAALSSELTSCRARSRAMGASQLGHLLSVEASAIAWLHLLCGERGDFGVGGHTRLYDCMIMYTVVVCHHSLVVCTIPC